MEIGETVKMSAISVSEESSIAVKKLTRLRGVDRWHPRVVRSNISRVGVNPGKATCRNCISQSLDFTDLLVLHADTFLLLWSTLPDNMTDIALTILAYGKTCGRPTMLI